MDEPVRIRRGSCDEEPAVAFDSDQLAASVSVVQERLNRFSQGLVPVDVELPEGVDPGALDPESIRAYPGDASPVVLHPRRGGDVLRAFFSTPDLELPDAPETPLLVTGETTDGRRWRGQDSIELVPDPGRGNGEDGEDERAEAADDDGPDDGEGRTPGREPDGDGKRGPGRGPGNGRKRGRGPGRGDTEDKEGGGDDD